MVEVFSGETGGTIRIIDTQLSTVLSGFLTAAERVIYTVSGIQLIASGIISIPKRSVTTLPVGYYVATITSLQSPYQYSCDLHIRRRRR